MPLFSYCFGPFSVSIKSDHCARNSPISPMALPQVIAAFLALFDLIGLPGNLIVLVTIILEPRFHVMRYILLASLALSDFLMLILVNSFLIESIAQENWLYGQTMCYLNSSFARYFYINTIFHLVAVSYDRYLAIVKSPLTYDGIVTKTRVMFLALIWIIPVIPVSVGPFLGNLKYVLQPKGVLLRAAMGCADWFLNKPDRVIHRDPSSTPDHHISKRICIQNSEKAD